MKYTDHSSIVSSQQVASAQPESLPQPLVAPATETSVVPLAREIYAQPSASGESPLSSPINFDSCELPTDASLVRLEDDAARDLAEDSPETIASNPEKGRRIAEMWECVALWLRRGKLANYQVGCLLVELRRELGHGYFMLELKKFAKQSGMSVPTLYRRMDYFRAVELGQARLSAAEAVAGSQDVAGTSLGDIDLDDKLLADQADDKVAAYVAHIEACAALSVAQVKAHKASGLPSAATFKVDGLKGQERDFLRTSISRLRKELGSGAFNQKILVFIGDWVAELPSPAKPKAKKRKPAMRSNGVTLNA